MRIATAVKTSALAVMIAVGVMAQQPNDPQAAQGANSGGWRRIGDSSTLPPAADAAQADPQAPAFAPPPVLTIARGTFLTIRLNQTLSSDRNHQGDAFSGTLVNPVVVDGRIVAERGQTILGTVSETKKAGLLHGSSSLVLRVTDLTVVDGHQTPVETSLISRNGPGNGGRNAATIGGTTAVGAGVGAVAAGGTGAAAGAGAGLALGTLGALLTPGYPTVVYPEQVLTFRVESPVVISTATAPLAFRPVTPQDYQQAPPPPGLQRRPPLRPYAYGPYPYYGYPYYPYYWGPAVGIGVYGRIR